MIGEKMEINSPIKVPICPVGRILQELSIYTIPNCMPPISVYRDSSLQDSYSRP